MTITPATVARLSPPTRRGDDIWTPNLDGHDGPLYLAIADSLAQAIANGTVPAGTRLPTHRDLAIRLGVTIGTVTRAYAEAGRRGLTDGTVGRGTFVRGPDITRPGSGGLVGIDHDRPVTAGGTINLSVNRPAMGPQVEALQGMLADLSARPDVLAHVMGYQFPAGAPAHRAAGAAWMRQAGIETTPDRVLVTAGCQNAQTIALMTVARPGDVLLTEALAYPGLTSLARRLGLTLEAVALDDEGMRPDALEAACRGGGRRFVYLTPTIQNPTTAVMGEQRRRDIAAVANRCDALLIEDDVHGFLAPGHTPIAMLAPERTLFVTSVSKALMPGLRVGYMALPQRIVDAATETMRATTLMAPPLMAEVVGRWVADGTAERLTRWQLTEIARRNEVAERCFGLPGPAEGRVRSFHVWLKIGNGRRADDVVDAARAQGVHVAGASAFQVGRGPAPEAIRISLSAAADIAELTEGLNRIAEALRFCPDEPALI
ncbi:PLP-dependent aminotransferase family protein [Zavarzinia compransoris]|uniref:PLP-dependent aminotransferase family protein n=1 Tax=Zavarzinia compransoris TaxID=1264899 RepID=A0A317E6V2_9PROT|nr:PLP-dependent aminotransferase family protein [Zavarzinia compransoris]PWR21956.1 PLP-dependent aminotransferase family protein [Zavarzinia compransoris]TDP47306.1 DNA-binding transcriptional MocR family regulator [Zavarzinia compransoris]